MNLKQLLIAFLLLLISFCLVFPLAAQTTVGLLAHFKMDGSITNLGTSTVTGTPIGTSYTTNNANVANKAIQFAGNLSSYVDFTDDGAIDFTGNANFTISFSFFFNGAGNSGLVDNCLNYGGWGVWLWSTVAGTWNLQFNYKGNSVGSAAATDFTTNAWHHVAAVRNNGTISLYIDGVFRMSAAEGAIAPTYPIHMLAGAFTYSSFSPPRYNPLLGKLDELRIYNRALTAGEIAILIPFSLPLKLGDFTAVKQANNIKLNWQTITEQNTSHFEIERSTDGNNYTTIGQVAAAGNSSDKLNYTFTDTRPAAGTNFYRLRMVDLDATATYSRIVVVRNENMQHIEIFPVPAKDVLQVQIPASQNGQATVTITDMAGKIMQTRTQALSTGTNAVSLPVLSLPAGMYWLTVANNESRQVLSFVKQ